MLKTDAFIKKKFNSLYLASLLGWFICIIGHMADSVLAGVLLSEEAVSAVELVVPLGTLTLAIGLPVATGAAMMYSQFAGAFEMERAHQAAYESLVTSIGIGVILAGLLLVCKDVFLDFYGASGQIRALASEYYNAYVVIALVEPTYWCVYQLVLVDGDEGLNLLLDIAMAVINAGVSLLLGRRMGIRGLGIGTLASYVLTIGFLFTHFRKPTNSVHFRRCFRGADVKKMAYTGSSAAMCNIYLAIVDIVMNRFIITRFGDCYLPAYAVVNTVMNLAAVLVCSYDGAKAFVTVGIGEQNNYSIRRIMRLAARSEVISAIVVTALFQLAAPFWASLYGISSPEVIRAATFAGRAVPLTYLAAAFVFMFQTYYPGIGEVLLGNVLAFSYMLAGPLVLAVPMALLGGFNAMTTGFALTPIFALVVCLVVILPRRHGRKIPLLLPLTDEVATSFDLRLTPEHISALCEKVRDYLGAHGVEAAVSNQMQMLIEETFLRVIEKNPKKKVLADATVLVSPAKVRLITRDNGTIFDITDTNAEIRDLRCYVLSQLLTRTEESSYATTISFNRNMYIWERTPAAE